MPLGPSSRPQEPLHVFGMAIALAVAAFLGGALGLVWHWAAGEDVPEDAIEAVSQPVEEEEEEEREPVAPPSPAPAPTPRPSPNSG
jgi:hypothetical protein